MLFVDFSLLLLIFSLSLIFVNLIIVSTEYSSLCLSYLGLSELSGHGDCFLSHVGIFQLLSLQIFSQVLSLSSCGPYDENVGAFNVAPEVSQTLFFSFSFLYILFYGSDFHNSVFQLIYPFFCLIVVFI